MDQEASSTAPKESSGAPFREAIEGAAREAHGLIDQFSAATQPSLEQLTNDAHALVERLARAAAGEPSAAVVEAPRAAAKTLGDACQQFVRSNPLAAVGLALAAGYLISRAVRKP